MASRTRTTFAKRQKELARQEKQRAKTQRRLERKLNNQTAAQSPDLERESSGGTEPPAAGQGST
jgi:hypothetical protein